MALFRKITVILGVIAFVICSLALDLMGGLALTMNNYESCGYALIASVGAFAVSLILIFFKKSITDILSIIFNTAATLLYTYPISVLNAIPNEQVPRASIEILTGRIYPSILVSVLFAAAVFSDLLSEEKSAARAEKKLKKYEQAHRKLNDDEMII